MVMIDRIIHAFGGSQVELARELGVTKMAITQWRRRDRIPAERVLRLERLTGGRVTRHEMRPDLYPPDERGAA
jgi:DNA-binding transcriptional regulator YdaS (Cro superfamily)